MAISVTHFTDPGCPWAYSASPALAVLHWRYGDPEAGHVDPWEVREEVAATFDDFVSESIQHLVHEMGVRLLERFPQVAEVSFAAENRTRDPVAESVVDPRVKVYSDPFPAYGVITLTMTREAMGNERAGSSRATASGMTEP